MWLIQSGTLTRVVLEFMVPGHSYLPCDRKFGQLETKFKHHDCLYTPEAYREIIAAAPNTSCIVMDNEKLINFKDLVNYIQHRTGKVVKFSKARRMTLYFEDPWAMHLEGSQQLTERVDLNKRNNKTANTSIPEQMNYQLKHKYTAGRQIQLSAIKIKHLGDLEPYMNATGQRWVKEVLSAQRNALPRPRTAEDTTDEDLTQDNHIADEYEDPQYVDPIEPPVVEGDEPVLQPENQEEPHPQPELEQPPPAANPKRGTKRKKGSEKGAKPPKKKK